MGQHYRRQSFSTWAFWTTLLVGGTLYGAYRFDWFPIGVRTHAATPEEEHRPSAGAKGTDAANQSLPDGRIEVAQSPVGPQSEPAPEFDEPAANKPADHSAKARLLVQRAENSKPKQRVNPPTPSSVEPAGFEEFESRNSSSKMQTSAAKTASASGQILRTSHVVVEPEPAVADPALAARIEKIDRYLEFNDLLRAHRELSTLYWSKPQCRREIQERIDKTARAIYFEPQMQFLEPYIVKPRDQFAQIANPYNVAWQYLAKLNHVDPKKLRPGQRLKVIKGPFSAIVELDSFLLTVHAYGYYVRAYPIGIGRDRKTPIGKFTVVDKVVNPQYTDPQGHIIEGGEPNNPIGSRWIDLGHGYGIHGTIDPNSIGKAESRGCIRLRNEDVEEVFDLLTVGSEVAIRG